MKYTIALLLALLAVLPARSQTVPTDRKLCQASDPAITMCEQFNVESFKSSVYFRHNASYSNGSQGFLVEVHSPVNLCKSCITIDLTLQGELGNSSLSYNTYAVPNGTGFTYYITASFPSSKMSELNCTKWDLSNGYSSFACDVNLNFSLASTCYSQYNFQLYAFNPNATANNTAGTTDGFTFTNASYGGCLDYTALCRNQSGDAPVAMVSNYKLFEDFNCTIRKSDNYYDPLTNVYVVVPLDDISASTFQSFPIMFLMTRLGGYTVEELAGFSVVNTSTTNITYAILIANYSGSAIITAISSIEYTTAGNSNPINRTRMTNIPIYVGGNANGLPYTDNNDDDWWVNCTSNMTNLTNSTNMTYCTNGTNVAMSSMGTGTILAIVLPIVAVFFIAAGAFAYWKCKNPKVQDVQQVVVNGDKLARASSLSAASDLESAASEKPSLKSIPVAPVRAAS